MYSNENQSNKPSLQQSDVIFERKTRNPKRWYKRWWGRIIIIFLAILLVIFIALSIYVIRVTYLLRTGQITPQQLFGSGFPEDQFRDSLVLEDPNDPFLGLPDAKVVIVEFSDFQCPFCAASYPVIKQVLRSYGDQVRFVYKDFPAFETHPEALIAALAGQCAHEQGKFWEMHDKIFENQANITEADLKRYAVQIGLNSIQFGTCLGSDKYLSEVEKDLRKGLELGVEATPTFFINNIKVRGAAPYEVFQKAIVAELNK